LTDLPVFDANTIDPMTVVLEGMSFEDGLVQMRGKNDTVPMVVDQDYDGDGDIDRVVNLETERLTAEGLDAYCEIGALTYDGYVVLGVDIAHLAPVGDRVYISTEHNVLWVLKAGRKKEVFSRCRLQSMAITPRVEDSVLYLPTQKRLFALRITSDASPIGN